MELPGRPFKEPEKGETMNLLEKSCKPCKAGTPPLDSEALSDLMAKVPHWKISAHGIEIFRHFTFPSYLAGLDFVTAVARMADAEDHHPDIELGYKKANVRFATHSIGGLSMNDFICAAKTDQLFGA
jgi:4a-hydroxytetrahydrobiopterin dehydratase